MLTPPKWSFAHILWREEWSFTHTHTQNSHRPTFKSTCRRVLDQWPSASCWNTSSSSVPQLTLYVSKTSKTKLQPSHHKTIVLNTQMWYFQRFYSTISYANPAAPSVIVCIPLARLLEFMTPEWETPATTGYEALQNMWLCCIMLLGFLLSSFGWPVLCRCQCSVRGKPERFI